MHSLFIMKCMENYSMKLFFLIIAFFFTTTIYAETVENKEPIVIEDTSGLTEDEVRKIAKESDKETSDVHIKKVFEVTDEEGKVDVSKLQASWEEQSPTPDKYDWVQTKNGEWFKGEIKSMYDEELEFDSDEIGLYTFDFEDISQIKSYYVIGAKIEKIASFVGLLRFKDDKLTIIQGDSRFTFPRNQIVSFAKSGDKERNYWSGKITISLDKRAGNKNQFDYAAQANIDRKTESTRLRLTYLGRVSVVEDTQTANDHRINEKFDTYITRDFFLTPLFSEYFQDSFQNIDSQYTVGTGLGMTLIDSKRLEWDVSGGPAYIKTNYTTVLAGQSKSSSSPSMEVSTRVEYELSKTNDITYDVKMTFTNEKSGTYKHHMVLKLENELLSWLDFDITGVWDYTKNPEIEEDGTTPDLNDYQFLLGLGIEF